MNTELYYLDHAAATPIDPRVLREMQPYFTEHFFNPSSPYASAVEVKRAYRDAKCRIAACIGVKSDEIIMTAGATESINLACTVARDAHIVTSEIEHHAVLHAARQYECTLVACSETGVVLADAVCQAITDRTQLVSIALANNEVGTVQPLRKIAEGIELVRQQRRSAGNARPIWLHADASQGVGQIDIQVARLGVDMLTLNSGKIYGPKQVGCLWARSGVTLSPVIVGGGQERGYRSGTENVAGAVGFARALELASEHRKYEYDRLSTIKREMTQALMTAFPYMVVTGAQKRQLPGHLHISFPGLDAERLLFALERKGVMVATGSACAANKGTRSHVLTAMGVSDEVADGSLRITFGHLSTTENCRKATEYIIEVVRAEMERTR